MHHHELLAYISNFPNERNFIKMAGQSEGIRKLMQAEQQAVEVVNNAKRSK